MEKAQEGPKRRVRFSCFECKFCKSKRYDNQDDTDYEIFCTHSKFGDINRYIGTNWDTPTWCPYRFDGDDEPIVNKLK